MSIKRFARNSTATLALVFAAFSAQAASYTPTGVQNDVDYNSVLNGGWKIVYQGAYGATASISDLFGSIAAGSKVMLAAKNVASSVFDVLAWAGLATAITSRSGRTSAANQAEKTSESTMVSDVASFGFLEARRNSTAKPAPMATSVDQPMVKTRRNPARRRS